MTHFVVSSNCFDELLFGKGLQGNFLTQPLVVAEIPHFICGLVKAYDIGIVDLVVEVVKDLGVLDVVYSANVKSFAFVSTFFSRERK